MAFFDIKSSPNTQRFLEIADIRQGVVITKSGGLKAVLMCSSINFALKAKEEQEALIYRFQNFLNTLEFPIQIVINSRQINLDRYIADLENRGRQQKNELLKLQTQEYTEFIKSLITLSNVISKYFYVVVPFSPTETKKGFFQLVLGGLRPSRLILTEKTFSEYKNQLWQRLRHVQLGLEEFQIKAQPLNTQELIELFYNLYNPEDKMKETTLNIYELGTREVPEIAPTSS